MRSSDSLFRLIKAMSKGDRRNFKLFAKLQDGDKKYIQLFDAIDKQEEYDEKALLEQFKGERFTNQFSVAKNYLYNYILKTLHVFHKDQYTDLSTLMHQIQILMGKSLFDQAQKLIRKGKHMAERQERFQEMLYLLEFERGVLHNLKHGKQFNAFMGSIQEQENEALQKLLNLQELHHIYDEIYLLRFVSTKGRKEDDKLRVDSILRDPLLASEECAISIRGKVRQLEILSECYTYKGDYQSCITNASRIIDIYEANPSIRREKNLQYINTISNYCVYSYGLGYKEDAFRMLAKLKSLETFDDQEKIRVFEKYFRFKIALCIEMGAIDEGRLVIAEFERESRSLEGKISKGMQMEICYLSGYFFIQIGEPSNSLNWINCILNEPKTELRTDLQCMARILNLIAHYELGNREFVDYNHKSTTRFLSNRERLFKFERVILKYIRQLANIHPDENPRNTLLRFQEDVEIVLQDESEKKALDFFEIQVWVASRIQGVTMAEIQRGRQTVSKT